VINHEVPVFLGACRQPSTNLRPHNRSCRLAALQSARRNPRRAERRAVNSSFNCKAGRKQKVVRSRTCIPRRDPSQARCLRPCERCRRLGKEALSLSPARPLSPDLGGVRGGKRLRCAMRSRQALPVTASALPWSLKIGWQHQASSRSPPRGPEMRRLNGANTHTSHPSTGSLRKVNSS
jgi:hypothetical protein